MQDVHDGEEKHHVKLSRHSTEYENIIQAGQLSSAPENVNTSANASSHGSSTVSVNEKAAPLNQRDAEEQPHTRDVEIDSGSKASSGLPYPSPGVNKHPIYRTASGIQAGPAPVPYPPIEHTPSNRSTSKSNQKEKVQHQDDEGSSPYPEGGLKAWSVVFGSFSGMTASFGVLNSVGTFQAYLSTHQLAQESPSSIGWIFSLLAFLTFFCGVQIGPVFDAKGPRWLVAAGSVLLFAGMMGVAESTKLWHFLITYSILCGVASSLIFTPAIGCVAHFFSRRRGEATGLAATGGSIGGIVFPLMLQRLFPLVGFKWAVRILAFIFLFLLTFANLLIRSNPLILPPTKAKIKTEDILPDYRIFKHKIFALTTAGVFFIEWALFIPISYISSYAIANGVNETFSYQVLSILNAGSFFGRWLPGYMADKCGRFNAMIVTCALCLISVLCLWLTCSPASGPGGIAQLCIFAVLFGMASGSNISLTPVCVGQLCETEVFGRWYASLYTIVSFGCLTGIPIAGQILKIDGGSYEGLILFTGGCYAIGVGCFVWARVSSVGWGLRRVY